MLKSELEKAAREHVELTGHCIFHSTDAEGVFQAGAKWALGQVRAGTIEYIGSKHKGHGAEHYSCVFLNELYDICEIKDETETKEK